MEDKEHLGEDELLELCKSKVVEKLNWDDPSTWKHSDYKLLSDKLFESSKISLSISTLKRLWGKVIYDGGVSNSSKNALSIFLGYESWQDFRKNYNNEPRLKSSNDELENPHSLENNTFEKAPYSKKKIPKKLIQILAFSFSALILVFILVSYVKPLIFRPKIFLKDARLNGKYPFTVFFRYQTQFIDKKEPVLIDFGNLVIDTIYPSDTINTFFYREPNYYQILFKNKKGDILAKQFAHITSGGWLLAYAPNGHKNFPKYFLPLPSDTGYYLSTNNFVYLRPKNLDKHWTELIYIEDINANGDDLNLEIKTKNTPRNGGVPSYDLVTDVLCENGKIRLHFIHLGSFKWVSQIISEKEFNGETMDLSMFENDMSNWSRFGIKVKNNKAEWLLNANTVFKSDYTQPLGSIKGLKIIFKGEGMIDYLRIFDNSGTLVFEKDFGEKGTE